MTASPSVDPALTSIPTLMDQGVNVELANWRGIVAPPGVSAEDQACIVQMITQMHDSQAWQDALDVMQALMKQEPFHVTC